MKHEINVECVCGCIIVKVTKDVEDNTFTLSAYENNWMVKQGRVKGYFQRLWSALKGQDHFLYEAILPDEDMGRILELYRGENES